MAKVVAIVVAYAASLRDGVVITSDPLDLCALAEQAATPVSIVAV